MNECGGAESQMPKTGRGVRLIVGCCEVCYHWAFRDCVTLRLISLPFHVTRSVTSKPRNFDWEILVPSVGQTPDLTAQTNEQYIIVKHKSSSPHTTTSTSSCPSWRRRWQWSCTSSSPSSPPPRPSTVPAPTYTGIPPPAPCAGPPAGPTSVYAAGDLTFTAPLPPAIQRHLWVLGEEWEATVYQILAQDPHP
ncbi:hypothetical protein BGW80DRAFT_857903 [Lactifluus volemus]|nr:hypothetical protein BGW80DRAFT_857903 [Lactifluus volemus]